MKHLIYLIFALLFCSFSFGQNEVSKVVYICQTQIDKGDRHDGLNTLYFSQEEGLFIHNDYPVENEYSREGNIIWFIKGDDEGLPVYVNLKEKYIKYKEDYSSGAKNIFIIEEPLPKIDWDVRPENKTIGNFKCVKAVGNFGNRTYDVWFTPEIPVPLGPYKLGGLPGMILEAKSRDGCVSYTFKEYESPTSDKVDLSPPKNGKNVTWLEFKKYVINKLLKAESFSTSNVTVTNNDPPANWAIEKSKFTILSEYKKKRGY